MGLALTAPWRAMLAVALVAAAALPGRAEDIGVGLLPAEMRRAIEDADRNMAPSLTYASVQTNFVVGERGASHCAVAVSSGHPSLDEATCRITAAAYASSATQHDMPVQPGTYWQWVRWARKNDGRFGVAMLKSTAQAQMPDGPAGAAPAGYDQSRTVALYTISESGKAKWCQIIEPSPHPELDCRTCELIEQKFRFRRPPRGSGPQARHQIIVWRFEGGAPSAEAVAKVAGAL